MRPDPQELGLEKILQKWFFPTPWGREKYWEGAEREEKMDRQDDQLKCRRAKTERRRNPRFSRSSIMRVCILWIPSLHMRDTFGAGNVALCKGVFKYVYWVRHLHVRG